MSVAATSPDQPESSDSPRRLGRVESVQVGRARRHGTPGAADPLQRPWRSGFVKTAVDGPVAVGAEGLDGDEQAERRFHGGPDKAVLMYSADHFPTWRAFGLSDIAGGGFGENLTVSGFTETDICIGDRLQVGPVVLEVSQPRSPCSKINKRWGRPGVMEEVLATGRSGWYLRVLQPGAVHAEDEVILLSRPFPRLSIATASDVLFERNTDPDLLIALITCPNLAESWSDPLKKRLAKRR